MALCGQCGSEFEPNAPATGTTLVICRRCSDTRQGDSPVSNVTSEAAARLPDQLPLHLDARFSKKYQLGDLLGSGGAGSVYRAIRMADGTAVAVKFLLASESDVALARFMTEGFLMTEIDHPNVVKVTDSGHVDKFPFIVCELMEGGSLESRLRRKTPMSAREGLMVVIDALNGLQVIHSRGAVHRDLKPANILLTKINRAKLSDLGIVKEYGDAAMQITLAGQLIGTPLYMAPEQLRGEAVTVASDIYSAAVVLYEVLTGKLPLNADSLGEFAQIAQTLVPEPVTALRPELPGELAALVARALSKDRSLRPSSAEEFAQSLTKIRANLAPPRRTSSNKRIPTIPPVSAPDDHQGIRLYIIIATVVMTSVGLLGLIIRWGRQWTTTPMEISVPDRSKDGAANGYGWVPDSEQIRWIRSPVAFDPGIAARGGDAGSVLELMRQRELRDSVDAGNATTSSVLESASLVYQQTPGESVSLLQDVLRKDSRCIAALLDYGNTRQLAGKLAEAEEQYQKVLRVDSDQAQARFNLAMVHILRGRRKDGLLELKDLLALTPDDAVTRRLVADPGVEPGADPAPR